MQTCKFYAAIAGAASLACVPAIAQSQRDGFERAQVECRELIRDMQREVRRLDLGQQLNSRVDDLVQQARQASSNETCVRTLRQANGLINNEIGERPLSDQRFRQALQEARSGQQSSSLRQSQASTLSQSAQSRSDASRITVTYTSEIVGRTINDNQGNEAGELEYVVIDTRNSDIRFAVISSGGLFDIGDELTAVPWKNIDIRPWGQNSEPRLRLTFGIDKLREGRRITEDTIDQLADPSYQTSVISFYLPIDRSTEGQAQDQKRQTQSDSGASASQESGSDQGTRARSEQRQSTQDGQQRQASQQDGQASQELMLVGRELITTIARSPLRTSSQVRGATVRTSDGREAGEIDRLVVDVERGKVAYALVAKGGFLGIGEEWRAVPLAALRSTGQASYTLDQSQHGLATIPILTRDELPRRIRLGDLRRLYQAYDVTPYWQDRSQSQTMQSDRQDSSR